MDSLDIELKTLFQRTEAPTTDDAFIWGVLGEYERRSRAAAIAWKAAEAAAAALASVIILITLDFMERAAFPGLADVLRTFLLFVLLAIPVAFAGMQLRGGGLSLTSA